MMDMDSGQTPEEPGILPPKPTDVVKIEGRGQSMDQLRFLTKQLEHSIDRANQDYYRISSEKHQTLLGEISAQMPAAIQTLRNALADMNSLSNGIRTLTYLDERPLFFEDIDCNELVAELVRVNNLYIETNRVKVEITSLDNIVADKQSLQDIFQGLFDNALKYLDPERNGRIKIRSHRDINYTTFCIEDNGRGIAPKEYDRVYDVFQRSDEVVHISGEGMGIPYVQVLVRRMGGTLWFHSEHGKGTTFYFTVDNHLARAR